MSKIFEDLVNTVASQQPPALAARINELEQHNKHKTNQISALIANNNKIIEQVKILTTKVHQLENKGESQ